MTLRALVVRSGAIPFSAESRSLSFEVLEKSSHAIETRVSGGEALDEPADLAIFTSQIAARRLAEEPGLLERFRRALSGGRVGAVGEVTAESLRAIGLPPDIVGAGSSDSFLKRLPATLSGRRVLLPSGADAAEDLAQELSRRGARVARLVLYRKVLRPSDPEVERVLLAGSFFAFFPTSPSAALWLFGGLSAAGMERLRRIPAAVLGRFTRRYLGAHGIERVVVAREATFGAAAEALERLADESRPA